MFILLPSPFPASKLSYFHTWFIHTGHFVECTYKVPGMIGRVNIFPVLCCSLGFWCSWLTGLTPTAVFCCCRPSASTFQMLCSEMFFCTTLLNIWATAAFLLALAIVLWLEQGILSCKTVCCSFTGFSIYVIISWWISTQQHQLKIRNIKPDYHYYYDLMPFEFICTFV